MDEDAEVGAGVVVEGDFYLFRGSLGLLFYPGPLYLWTRVMDNTGGNILNVPKHTSD